ncbi:anti-sigma-F factor Fin family protein [Paraliobacillus ryukyuensis]|uniref:anti-sigma-F factor Fin family protein n=1 Tax=Paraliobacillus ryukyuensis TaxID=200904 RepID=UPI0009A63E60|nr:anti-sigma-F factor Fin family protein [Paraliobacillus ryukyuensis]
MAIRYTCRHCKKLVGTIEQKQVHAQALGLDFLSTEDRKEMIRYDANGNMNISVICEDCQEILEHYPDYHALDSFIH